jgi:hypothetical protein
MHGKSTFLLLTLVCSSTQLLEPQTNLWNASFQLTADQIKAANISQETAHNVDIALRYERTNNAGSLIQDNPFYDLPDDYGAESLPTAGSAEKFANSSLSISRWLP